MNHQSIAMLIVLVASIFLAKRATVFNLTISSVINLLALAIATLAFAFIVLEIFAVGTIVSFGEWTIAKGVIMEAICFCGAIGITLFFADRLLAKFSRRRS